MNGRRTDLQSPLRDTIRDFLAHKRALGRRFRTEESALRLLDSHLVGQGIESLGDVTPQLLEGFLASRPRARSRSYNHLLGVLRRYFAWLVAQGKLDTSPVRAHPRRGDAQRRPFLFDPDLARRLVTCASQLPDNARASGRGQTYAMIFLLLYGLGLRVSEVAHLRGEDVNLDQRLLVIRQTKFAKSRLVPFGPRIGERLDQYLEVRQQAMGALRGDDPLFSFTPQRPIHPGTISQVFHRLIGQLDLERPPGVASPSVHCLRHSFAVGTLLRWYREGIDPNQRLLHLSTFLGHVNPASTAVYLTITTTLPEQANQRFEQWATPLPEEANR